MVVRFAVLVVIANVRKVWYNMTITRTIRKYRRSMIKIINNHGIYSQLNYLKDEEMGELVDAIVEFKREPNEINKQNLVDELTDNLHLILQLAYALGEDKIADRLEYKVRRQVERDGL